MQKYLNYIDSNNIVKRKTSVCCLVGIKEFPWPQDQPRSQGSLLAAQHLFATPHSSLNKSSEEFLSKPCHYPRMPIKKYQIFYHSNSNAVIAYYYADRGSTVTTVPFTFTIPCSPLAGPRWTTIVACMSSVSSCGISGKGHWFFVIPSLILFRSLSIVARDSLVDFKEQKYERNYSGVFTN